MANDPFFITMGAVREVDSVRESRIRTAFYTPLAKEILPSLHDPEIRYTPEEVISRDVPVIVYPLPAVTSVTAFSEKLRSGPEFA